MDLENEYLDLPDDPEEGFVVLQKRRHDELQAALNGHHVQHWHHERRYVDQLIAYDEVHGLGLFTAFGNPPTDDQAFSEFFQEFRRYAEIAVQKILMEQARRVKTGAQQIVVLDAPARSAIHKLIQAIRDKLNDIDFPEDKRESLFNKLNAFAAEVDRNRTRTEAFFALAVEVGRTSREVNDQVKPLQETIDRIFGWIEKAAKWKDALPPWSERKKIEPPPKRLPAPELDDEIPF